MKQRGFTLLEIMVALMLFALGAVSLSKVIGSSALHVDELARRQFAGLLAHNQMLVFQMAGRLQSDSGKAVQGPFEFTWEINVNKTDTDEILRLDLDVFDDPDDAPLAQLSAFTGAAK
ncbi:MAG TPA: type II secretion system protein GspI [Spongiibacteraceae bacterium]|nr:type II secretion system protein GspI [Spongiibacteraceae bacterium]HCS27885.1 type II secretion system protein GspI [Spongiibacteraceae bacterium]|tara:strand:+ start:6498 stop:6851 length:354 start_codon:yes stop_codon:yes gene_type:complete